MQRMKDSNSKKGLFYSFINRFLAGLVLSLAVALTAFEWTTITTKNTDGWDDGYVDKTEIILPPITYRIEKLDPPKVQVKKPLDQLTIIEDFSEAEFKKEESKISEVALENKAIMNEPTSLFEAEIITEDIPYTKVQVFAHYDACSGLLNEQLMECSMLDIQNRIKKNFKVTSLLKSIGGKQAVLMSFVVDKEGEITNIVVDQSSSKAMAKAAVKSIEKLPKMHPAQQQGKTVSLSIKIPIVVRIE